MTSALHEHQARISRQYIQRIANLIKLERFDESADSALYFASILRLWAVQQKKLQERAMKDGSAAGRNKLTSN